MNPSDLKVSSRDSRRLTVTYYVEPQNLRTISIPVRRANLLIVTFGLASLWTIASISLLTVRAFSSDGVDDAPRVAEQSPEPAAPAVAEEGPRTPSMVHDDPTDAVVAEEHAAVNDDTADVNALKVELPKTIAVAAPTGTIVKAEDQLLTDMLGAPSVSESAKAGAKAKTSEPAERTAVAAADEPAERAAVEAPNFLYKEGKFDAAFKIKNLGKSELKGRVWGVATFAAADGRVLTVPSATGIDANRPDDAGVNAEHGVTYRARVRTAKELGFEVPAGETGHFSEVKIFVSDEPKDGDEQAEDADDPSVYISSFSLDEQGHPVVR